NQALPAGLVLNQNDIWFPLLGELTHHPLQLRELDAAFPHEKQIITILGHSPGRADTEVVFCAGLESRIPGLHNPLENWWLLIALPPFALEDRAHGRSWPLLVKGCPHGTPDSRPDAFKCLQREPFRPERLTLTTKALVGFGDRRKTDDIPVFFGVL